MRSRSPRQLDSDEALTAAALRALMRRAHSIHEMRLALERRTKDSTLIRRVMDRLKGQGLLDDARYALQFARQRAENRRQGRYRIARELRQRGVPDRHIEPALDAVFEETDEATLLRARIERKLRRLRGPLDQRKLASLYRSLMMAGFTADMIRRELRAAVKQQVPEVEPVAEEE